MLVFKQMFTFYKVCCSIGLALALPSNSKTRLERDSKVKPSNLLGLFMIDEGKKFYNIDTS